MLVAASLGCTGDKTKTTPASGAKSTVIFESKPAGKNSWLDVGWKGPIPLDGRVEKIVRVVADDISPNSGGSEFSIDMDRKGEWWCGDIKVYLDEDEEIDTRMILFKEKPRAHTVTASLNNYGCFQW